MATSRHFTYNPDGPIPGTESFGSLSVGTPTEGFESTGLQWWNGPDEDLGYVIAKVNVDIFGNPLQPTPVAGQLGNVGFSRTSAKTEELFIGLANTLTGQNFGNADDAKNWLESNGYWTSYQSAPVAQIIQDNLFVNLDASSYTSGQWLDQTGNGNNATINGATWISADGGVFDLDGTNDTIMIPHASQLSLSTSEQRSVQVWFKTDLPAAPNQQIPVLGKLSSNFGFDGYWAGLFSNAGAVRSVTNGTARQTISTSTLTIVPNVWYLLTFISQITGTSNTTKVYINETEYITAAHGADSYNETNPLYLGWIGSGVSSPYFNGKIGACYFYTKGLSSAEISNNFNVTKSKYGL